MFRTTLLLLALSLLAACGPNNPGSGTGTLFVFARLSTDGSPDSANARIQVREAGPNGALVHDAAVTVTGSKLPRVSIPWVEANSEYRLDGFGWDESLRLEVVRREDKLEATVRSPGTSAITAPAADAAVPQANALPITWRDAANEPAMTVRLRLEQAMVDTTLATDAFRHTVPAGTLVLTDREGLSLERSNEVALAGGAPGSAMSVATRHYLRFRVE